MTVTEIIFIICVSGQCVPSLSAYQETWNSWWADCGDDVWWHRLQ